MTNIKLEEEKEDILWYILGPILVFIFISLIIIFFVIKYIRLKNANINLKQDLKSMSSLNTIILNQKKEQNIDNNYDTNFI